MNNKARRKPKKSTKTASRDTNKCLDAEFKEKHDKKLEEKEALSDRSQVCIKYLQWNYL
ncbi:MAG: hypothetical protein QS748_05695 [Candidatus Endonucleobacter bathymodioli]|uniref:Uncharacterized protein n=1 Tax=Candidatus Endonucleibacter bathymodioli TaxID=539814 RepID=A0AA90SSM6_9GAMM|nr:hypothetical protein [Candidatus Endonucleobacter bathymodioli]